MEAPPPPSNGDVQPSSHNRGGWVTFPFIAATTVGLFIAIGGWMNNILVFMIEEFNCKTINSTQIWNVVHGCVAALPVLGAVVADSLGIFSTIWIFSLVNLLGLILFTIIATVNSLRPPPCEKGSSFCIGPTQAQLAILYMAITLSVIGSAGSRHILGTMGANQFDYDKPRSQRIFWDWFFFIVFIASAISTTLIVYIEDNVSWGIGFGLCAIANVISLVIFLCGSRFYCHVKPQGSPFKALARVVVAAIRKRKLPLKLAQGYYHGREGDGEVRIVGATPTKNFKFLNRAALISEGDLHEDGSIAKRWRLCTVEDVQDMKTLIKLLPLWSSGLFLATPQTMHSSLTTLQALTMNCSVGRHLNVPAGSILVFNMVSSCVGTVLIDRCLFPLWKKQFGRTPTSLQRVGVGHVLIVISMIVSALVESKRLDVAHYYSKKINAADVVPMSLFWLVPQLALGGFGDAFQLPGHTIFYYQQFPATLKSTSTAVTILLFGIAFYISSAVVDVVQQTTGWLPDDINQRRMDNVYWVLAFLGTLNYGYFLICAWIYKPQGVEEEVGDDCSSSSRQVHVAPENQRLLD